MCNPLKVSFSIDKGVVGVFEEVINVIIVALIDALNNRVHLVNLHFVLTL